MILAGLFVGAGHAAVAPFGNWDGAWYGSIAQHGYEFARDGQKHSTAFFPLFPLLSAGLLHFGIGWPLAGVIINALSFLGTCLLLGRMLKGNLARWSIVILCCLPQSLFASVAYAEGLFLFLTTLSLWLHQRRFFALSSIAAGTAALTRPLGIALAIALPLCALRKRRNARDVFVSMIGLGIFCLYPAYCFVRFGDALAFVHAQTGWRSISGFDPSGWIGLARGAFFGNHRDWFSLGFLFIALPSVIAYRKALGKVVVTYALLSVGIVFFAGTPFSVDRILYAVIPLILGLAYLARHRPVFGYSIAIVGIVLLAMDAARFAQFQWTA